MLPLGTVVLTRDRLAVVRYAGDVHFHTEPMLGVELKGGPMPGGTDGSIGDQRYFECAVGKGLFITVREVARVVSGEELLEKLAGVWSQVKNSAPEEAPMPVDRQAYDDVARENARLGAQLTELELIVFNMMTQNEMLQEQAMVQMIKQAELHDKVYQFTNSIGMRRPTISGFDDDTLREIGELMRAKEDAKAAAENGQAGAQDTAAGAVPAERAAHRSRSSRVLPAGQSHSFGFEDDGTLTKQEKVQRRAKASVEMAKAYVEKHITGPMKKRQARGSIDMGEVPAAQGAKQHRRNQSSLEILNMPDWAENMYVGGTEPMKQPRGASPHDLITSANPMFKRNKRRDSLSAKGAVKGAPMNKMSGSLGGVAEDGGSRKQRAARGSVQLDDAPAPQGATHERIDSTLSETNYFNDID